MIYVPRIFGTLISANPFAEILKVEENAPFGMVIVPELALSEVIQILNFAGTAPLGTC